MSQCVCTHGLVVLRNIRVAVVKQVLSWANREEEILGIKKLEDEPPQWVQSDCCCGFGLGRVTRERRAVRDMSS